MYTILVCDDNKDIVDAIEIYLKGEGYQIVKAYSSKEALDVLDRQEIHLVLMDIMMPNMDGIHATMHLRESNNFFRLFSCLPNQRTVTKCLVSMWVQRIILRNPLIHWN